MGYTSISYHLGLGFNSFACRLFVMLRALEGLELIWTLDPWAELDSTDPSMTVMTRDELGAACMEWYDSKVFYSLVSLHRDTFWGSITSPGVCTSITLGLAHHTQRTHCQSHLVRHGGNVSRTAQVETVKNLCIRVYLKETYF